MILGCALDENGTTALGFVGSRVLVCLYEHHLLLGCYFLDALMMAATGQLLRVMWAFHLILPPKVSGFGAITQVLSSLRSHFEQSS